MKHTMGQREILCLLEHQLESLFPLSDKNDSLAIYMIRCCFE